MSSADQCARVLASKDLFAVLQLPIAETSADTVKSAYRKLALATHPDKNREADAEEAFKFTCIEPPYSPSDTPAFTWNATNGGMKCNALWQCGYATGDSAKARTGPRSTGICGKKVNGKWKMIR